MKKHYMEPQTEIIRYKEEDIITSSSHKCGIGEHTELEHVDSNGNGICNTDTIECNGIDYVCYEHNEGCDGDCSVVSDGDT